MLWMLTIGYRCELSMGNYTSKGATKLAIDANYCKDDDGEMK